MQSYHFFLVVIFTTITCLKNICLNYAPNSLHRGYQMYDLGNEQLEKNVLFSKFIGLTYKSNHLTLKNSKCCCVQWFVFSNIWYIQWLAEFIVICFCDLWDNYIFFTHVNNFNIIIYFIKAHIFWEGHKILRNLHLTFVLCSATQRARIAEKVHKPPLGINVINFELNGFNASIYVPWSSSDPQKCDALI